jgi:hypothetical protein
MFRCDFARALERNPLPHRLRAVKSLPLAALLLSAVLWPASAGAETRTFVNFDWLTPTEGAATEGPATNFPSTISVAGVAGTLTSVKVTTSPLRSTSPDDLDMALTGPNGQAVMLMSDTCGEYPNELDGEYFTFDDAAPGFLSDNGPCPNNQRASYRPSNYLGGAPEPEDFSNIGGPGSFVNNLAALAGGSPNGQWRLWLFDDNSFGYNGFGLGAWVLTLEVQPPPPPPPTVVTVQVPVPGPIQAQAGPTGKRAKALAKCKQKPNQEARKRCHNNARKLPL